MLLRVREKRKGKSGMVYLSKSKVIEIVSTAIKERIVLDVTYEHTDKSEIVIHQIAPFDIGSTNPKTSAQFTDALFAYSFTHIDDKKGSLAPRVCRFDVKNFIRMEFTDDYFNETELTELNLQVTRYDYRNCNFALLPNRDWYGR